MKNTFKITILLIGIISIASVILINDVLGHDTSDFSKDEISFIESLKDKEIRIHYNKDSLYFKDDNNKEFGCLLPLINIIKKEFNTKVTLVHDDVLSKTQGDDVIDLYTQIEIYKDNPDSFNTFTDYNSSLLIIGNKDDHISNINYGKSKNVGFLYNLPEYSKLKELYSSNFVYNSFNELNEALKSKEIDIAVIPSSNKLDLIDKTSLDIHLTLEAQEALPLLISSDKYSKDFFEILKKVVKNKGLSQYIDEVYNAATSYEEFYFKKLNYGRIEAVKKEFPKITVQLNGNQYPFSFKTNTLYDGYSVEILNDFKVMTGIDYDIYSDNKIQITDAYIHDLLENDEIQLTTTPIENNYNNDYFLFSDVIFESPLILSTISNNQNTYEDMTIGIVDKIASLVQNFHHFDNLKIYSDINLMLKDLSSGKLDAIITPETFFNYNNKDNNRILTLNKSDVLSSYVGWTFTMKNEANEFNRLFEDYLHAYKIFNHLEDTNLDFLYSSLNDDITIENSKFIPVLIISFSIVLSLILVLYINKRYTDKLFRLKLSYDEKVFDIHPLTGYYSNGVYYEMIKARVSIKPNAFGILTKWQAMNHDNIIKDYSITAWNKTLVKYKAELDKILSKDSLKFYLANGVFACYEDNFETIEDVRKHIDDILAKSIYISIDGDDVKNFYGSIVIYNHDTDNVNTLISYSDYTFNEAYNYNLNKVITFEESSYANSLNLSRKLEHFNNVLNNNLLSTVFQPIFDVQNNELYGFEGLSRTANENFSNIMELIEISQVAGKNFELSELMKKNVLKDFSQSQYKNIKLFINLDISNLDSLSVNYKSDIKYIDDLNILKNNIVIEITEGHKIEDYSKLNHICSKYRQNGMLIALDDFGAGYSNTYHVIKLKPNLIKLDRQLISNIDKDSYKQSVVKQQVNLAKELNIDILAEGVETGEELDFIRAIGVKLVQGYYLGKPSSLSYFNLKNSLSLLKA